MYIYLYNSDTNTMLSENWILVLVSVLVRWILILAKYWLKSLAMSKQSADISFLTDYVWPNILVLASNKYSIAETYISLIREGSLLKPAKYLLEVWLKQTWNTFEQHWAALVFFEPLTLLKTFDPVRWVFIVVKYVWKDQHSHFLSCFCSQKYKCICVLQIVSGKLQRKLCRTCGDKNNVMKFSWRFLLCV